MRSTFNAPGTRAALTWRQLALRRAKYTGAQHRYAHGDEVSLADLALVPHAIGARMFEADLTLAPRLAALAERCLVLPAFARAHPLAKPGTPARSG